MLFNSFGFLLVFLPIVFAIFYGLGKRSEFFAAMWLGFASLVFYGWWDYRYLPLLLGSIVFNYVVGRRIAGLKNQASKKTWMIVGVCGNLVLLGYYKYAHFFVSALANASGISIDFAEVVLPIGISFFTFTQIAFLVDTYQGEVKEYRFIHYLLFVTYFPHLIAGPVLHHKEMMPQFSDSRIYRLSAVNVAVGLSIFIIGLAKKVLVADNISPYANDLFSHPTDPSLLVAWGGVLAYAFQIYFDFSGYSDMAIGLSRLFGVKLPINFNSPYKSINIVEFWRRWHMTLSRFLRDYLYIPLGGNRHGQIRRYINLIITMLLGGLWHGAGWTYIVWGGLHGVYLAVNHAWVAARTRLKLPTENMIWKFISVTITFVAVCFAWVFFRAADLDAAWIIVKGLVGGFGIAIPNGIGAHLGQAKLFLESLGVYFFLGGGARFVETWVWVFLAAVIAFFLPNTQQIMRSFEPAMDSDCGEQKHSIDSRISWQPSRQWAYGLGFVVLLCLLSLNKPSEFLYFQF